MSLDPSLWGPEPTDEEVAAGVYRQRELAVIDAARAHVNDPEVDLPADWNVPHTPTFAALLDAVRALDGKTND